MRKILTDFGGKIAEPGSVMWAFEQGADGEWVAKFPMDTDEETLIKLSDLVESLEEHDDVTSSSPTPHEDIGNRSRHDPHGFRDNRDESLIEVCGLRSVRTILQ